MPGASEISLPIPRGISALSAVEGLEVATHRMVLLLLDHDRHGLRTLDLEVEQRVALIQDHPGVAAFDLKAHGVITTGVDDTGDLSVAAEPTGSPGAEFCAGRGVESCAF